MTLHPWHYICSVTTRFLRNIHIEVLIFSGAKRLNFFCLWNHEGWNLRRRCKKICYSRSCHYIIVMYISGYDVHLMTLHSSSWHYIHACSITFLWCTSQECSVTIERFRFFVWSYSIVPSVTSQLSEKTVFNTFHFSICNHIPKTPKNSAAYRPGGTRQPPASAQDLKNRLSVWSKSAGR